MKNQPLETLQQQNFREIYAKWVQGAGPFECFVRKTNFVSLKHYPDFPLEPVCVEENDLFMAIKSSLSQQPANCLTLLEVPGTEGIRLGFLLQTVCKIKPVLTFCSPLHPHGLVGGNQYVNALVGYAKQLPPITPVGYAFILDSNRYLAQIDAARLREKFNNQYELTADDLPSLEMLESLDCPKVLVLHREKVKDDLQAYRHYLAERITVEDRTI